MEKRMAIVTGAASGIGRALAEELARNGADVVLADRQVELAEEVASAIRSEGGAATVSELNVTDFGRFKRVVDDTVERAGRLDYLFNNAGIGVSAEMKDYDPADWDDVFDVNLRGVAYGIQAAYPVMVAQRFGHIVNTASMAGLIASPYSGSYTAAKHGVVGLSKTLRLEARQYGVRVSVVCPGVIRTPILEGGKYGRLKYRMDRKKMMDNWERFRPLAPDVLARRVLRAVDRNQAIIIEPGWWKMFWYLERLSSRLGERFAQAVLRRMQRSLEEMRLD